MDAYPPSRCGISDLYYIHDRSTRTPPIATIQLYDADCKTMPDFAAVKELVEQHVDSYTDTQEPLAWSKRWPFEVPYWSCKLFLDKMCLNHTS